MPKIYLTLLLTLLFLLNACKPFIFFGTWKSDSGRDLEQAEQNLRQEKYDEAIAEYQHHIAARLKVENRPDWENPYFYLLLIGDIQLRQGKTEEALKTFEEAEKQKVDQMLISDRYRYVASLYQSQGQTEKAMEILIRYRDRDPLLFNGILDRMAKEIVEKEKVSK